MMDKRKQTCLAIIALGTLFIGWRMISFAGRLSPATVSANPNEAPPTVVRSTDEEPVSSIDPRLEEKIKAQREVEDGIWGRDPFDPAPFEERLVAPSDAPPVEMTRAEPPHAPKIQFTGISRAGDRWLAAVNGEIVAIGDEPIAGFRVAAITKSSITLVSEGWAFRYELGQTSPDIRPQSEKP